MGEGFWIHSPDDRRWPIAKLCDQNSAGSPGLYVVCDKVAAEALRNAFRHSDARRVEVDIRYDTDQFPLRVRDDGKGIDPAVLANQGVEGLYGLRGIPERAALMGGKLAVWSQIGAGTELELRLPAKIAYATSSRRSS